MAPRKCKQWKAFKPGLRVTSLVDDKAWRPRALQKGDQGVIEEIVIDERQPYIKVDFGQGVTGWLAPDRLTVNGRDTPASREHIGVPSRKKCSGVASANGNFVSLPELPGALDEKCEILEELLKGHHSGQLDAAADELAGHVWELSKHRSGCRLVQDALGKHRSLSDNIVAELHGRAYASMHSPHANHVMQKVIEVKPPTQSSFIPVELMGKAGEVARHKFGCRIIIRLVEHCMNEPKTIGFINEVLEQASELCCDKFGCHVMSAILEHGGRDHKHHIAICLGNMHRFYLIDNFAMRPATGVILKALEFCSATDKQFLYDFLLGHPGSLLQIASHRAGVKLLEALFQDPVASCYKEPVHALLASSAGQLGRCGKNFLDALQRM